MAEKERGNKWTFDRINFTFQAFYFCFLSSFAAKLVYLPIYLKQLGLSASYVGILLGMIPFARGAGAPIMGYVADETNSRKLFFLVSIATHTIAPLLLLIPIPSEPECQSKVAMAKIEKPPNGTFQNKSGILTSNDEVDPYQSPDLLQIFLILSVLFIVTEFIAAPTKNLADSALLEKLDNGSSNYGKFRLWGNIGQILLYIIVTPLAKLNTVEVCNVPIQDDYGFTMFGFAIIMLGAFVVGLKIDFKQDEIGTTKSRRIISKEKPETALKDVLVNFHNIAFIFIVLYLGIVEGVFITFMFWYLTDVDPFQATWVMGVAGASRNIAAAFAFGYSGSVIRKLGVLNTINLSLAIYVVAFVSYGLLSNVWLAIIPEIMQYVAFAFSMPACILYFKERSPDEYSATLQGIVSSCYLGIGYGLGTIISGYLMDIIGGSWTFLVFGVVTTTVIFLLLVSMAISKLLERRKNCKADSETDDDEWS
ncbi:major facilitator superfamily domain-containing protein 6-like [Oculina patagonica]